MIGLDSNVVLRHLVQDDPVQSARATAIFENLLTSAEPAFVSTVVLVETVWVLRRNYRLSDAEAAEIVERLLRTRFLVVENETEVFQALDAQRQGLGDFADALIGRLATAAGCTTTLTFDRRALRLPGFSAA